MVLGLFSFHDLIIDRPIDASVHVSGLTKRGVILPSVIVVVSLAVAIANDDAQNDQDENQCSRIDKLSLVRLIESRFLTGARNANERLIVF